MYGEEPQAIKIAQAIIQCRQLKPIVSTYELCGLIARTIGASRGGMEAREIIRNKQHLHVATRTFQALRIFVNDELNNIFRSVKQVEQVLPPGGKLVTISFHSLEEAVLKFALGKYNLGVPGDQKEFMECLSH